jgi:hypothetical protein
VLNHVFEVQSGLLVYSMEKPGGEVVNVLVTGIVRMQEGHGEHRELVVTAADCVQNGKGEQGEVGLGPGPLKVGSATLVEPVLPDPVRNGAEMLPVCPRGEGGEKVLAELPSIGITAEEEEVRIVKELAKLNPEEELPKFPAELLPCGSVVPGEPGFEEDGSGTLGRLELSDPDVNWMVPTPGLDACAGIDDCGTLFVIELPPTFGPCPDVDYCEAILVPELPLRLVPWLDGSDCEALFGTELPLALDLGADAVDWEALFVVELSPTLRLSPDGSNCGALFGTELPLAVKAWSRY